MPNNTRQIDLVVENCGWAQPKLTLFFPFIYRLARLNTAIPTLDLKEDFFVRIRMYSERQFCCVFLCALLVIEKNTFVLHRVVFIFGPKNQADCKQRHRCQEKAVRQSFNRCNFLVLNRPFVFVLRSGFSTWQSLAGIIVVWPLWMCFVKVVSLLFLRSLQQIDCYGCCDYSAKRNAIRSPSQHKMSPFVLLVDNFVA